MLLKPSGNYVSWRARYTDPDTGKQIKVRLNPVEFSNAEARKFWAIRKSKELAKRQVALDEGAPRATGRTLAEVVERYYEAHPTLRAATVVAYKGATDKLLQWASETGLESADDLTRPKLMEFRTYLVNLPKRTAKKAGRRGQREVTPETRSPISINRELRAAGTVLGYLIELEALTKLHHDDVRRPLKRLKVTKERIDFLRPKELRSLLEAALRHDAETYSATRREHRGDGLAGSTRRYEPIAPMIMTVLLTGMRFGEALTLDWSHVDLSARDFDGRPVGELHLSGELIKTHQARTVYLEVCPVLRKLLMALRLRSGGSGLVFPAGEGVAVAAAKRLRKTFGAPESFTWQALRRSCGTYLTNAGGIYGSASAWKSAKQLGHSITIAERHYVDVIRISPRIKLLEQAMEIEDVAARVIASVGAMPGDSTAVSAT